jgi:hypothetical protein
MDSEMAWKRLTVVMVTVLSMAGAVRSQESGRPAGQESPTPTEGKVRYALKFISGQSYDVRVGIRMEADPAAIDPQLSKGQPKIVSDTILVYRFHVASIDETGTATAECKTTRVRLHQKLGYVPDVDYDSADPNKQVIPEAEGMDDLAYMAARTYRAYLGEKFAVKMTPYGQVQDIKGADVVYRNVLEKLGEKMPAGPPEAGIASMEMTLREFFLKAFANYPRQPVGLGDSWTETEKMSGRFEMETTRTLRERAAGVATIEVVTQPKAPDASKATPSSGIVRIDEATGRILSCTTRQSSQQGLIVTTFEMIEAND